MSKTRIMRIAAGLHQWAWWTRATTFGVRALVLDARGIVLVRHTYLDGWYLPGGGVDRGETAEEAIVRELHEEAGIACGGRPALHGLYRNGRRDHVACYVVRDFAREPVPAGAAWEIAEVGTFGLDALPEGTTRATRARIAEVVDGTAPSVDW